VGSDHPPGGPQSALDVELYTGLECAVVLAEFPEGIEAGTAVGGDGPAAGGRDAPRGTDHQGPVSGLEAVHPRGGVGLKLVIPPSGPCVVPPFRRVRGTARWTVEVVCERIRPACRDAA